MLTRRGEEEWKIGLEEFQYRVCTVWDWQGGRSRSRSRSRRGSRAPAPLLTRGQGGRGGRGSSLVPIPPHTHPPPLGSPGSWSGGRVTGCSLA